MNLTNTMLTPQQNDALRIFEKAEQVPYTQLRLSADICIESIENRCSIIAMQHEILSTRIVSSVSDDGNVHQSEVIDDATIYLSDLRSSSEDSSSSLDSEFITASIERDIRENYLQFSLYIHFDGDELYLSMPSWSGDVASLHIVARSLFFQGDAGGGASEDQDSVIQYIDLLPIFTEDLDSEAARAQRLKWTNYFINQPCLIHRSEFPTSRNSDSSSTEFPQFKQSVFNLQSAVGEDQFSILLAAWIKVLERHYQSKQLLIAFYHDGRGLEELDEVVGPLGKLLPLSVDLEKTNDTFALVTEVEKKVADACDTAEYFDWGFVEEDRQIYCHAGFEVLKPDVLSELTNIKQASSNVEVLKAEQRSSYLPISLQIYDDGNSLNQLRMWFWQNSWCLFINR